MATKRTKRFFISDVHLSSAELYKSGKSWFKHPEHTDRLVGFLDKHILGKPDVKDVVLLGDIFNTWVCPAKDTPPTYTAIGAANTKILGRFKRIAKEGINLFFVNGNHDFDLKAWQVTKLIPGIQPVRVYHSGLLHAEHGHRFDEIFNKPDYLCDPAFGRPIGYIMSRLVTSFSTSGYGIVDLPTYLDDVVEAAMTSQNLFESIIEGLAERAGMADSDAIKMPNGKKLSIADAKTRYSRLGEKYSIREFIAELWSRSALGRHADRLCHQADISVVIFGHSHKALIDKDFVLVDDRIYANSGSWCKQNAYCVEVDKRSGNGLEVKLHKVDPDGNIAKTVVKKI